MILTPITAEQAAPLLQKAVTGKADAGAGVGVLDLMRGASLWGVVGVAGVSLAVALRRVGDTCWITGVGGVGHERYIDKLLSQVEVLAAEMGCDQVALVTARRGVVKKMTKADYKETSVIMRKGLSCGRR